MGHMQTQIMAAAQNAVAAQAGANVQFVNQPQYANHGVVYLCTRDFDSLGAFTYDFQDTYASLSIVEPGRKPQHTIGFTADGQTDYRIDYHDAASIQRFLTALREALRVNWSTLPGVAS